MNLSPTYLDHFQSPRNIGDVPDADARAEVEHEGGGCQDRLRITLRVGEGGLVEQAMFRARACSGTIAAASAATEWARGKTLDDLSRATPQTLIDFLGGIPPHKNHSVELAAAALRKVAGKTGR